MTFADSVNFKEEVLDVKGKVVVDFYAVWCGPCKMLSPIFEELEGKYAGKVKFVKVDTDQAEALAMKFGISAIPTVLLFEDGALKDGFVGLRSKADIEAFLNA